MQSADCERAGCGASPTAAVHGAQAAGSGGAGMAGEHGFDPARRVVGCKRRRLTNTDEGPLLAAISSADLHDSHSAVALLQASRRSWPFLARRYADRADTSWRVGDATG